MVQLTQEAEAKVNGRFSENALKMIRKRYLIEKPDGTQETPAEMFARVASALAQVERNYGKDDEKVKEIEQNFFEILSRKEYTPAGRTMRNAGADTSLVANCIVLPIHDSMESIFQTLKDAALLQQAGSGLGFDLSEMRPAMAPTKRSQGSASGPVSFLRVYDAAFGTIKQQSRHGANMSMLRVDHPDVLDFIHCKQNEGEIRNFNISVTVTDEFMQQLEEAPDSPWRCTWNGQKVRPHKVLRHPNGSVYDAQETDITVQQLFDELVEGAWQNGEPGIAFLDTWNRANPLPDLGPLAATNPCVTGDTLVATEKGLLRMEELVAAYDQGGVSILTDQRVPRPFNAFVREKSLVGPREMEHLAPSNFLHGYLTPAGAWGVELQAISRSFRTGMREVVKIITKQGYELTATPDHKVLTTEGWVEAKDVLGKNILIQSGKGFFGSSSQLPFAVANEVIGKNGRTYCYNFPKQWSKELGQVLGMLIGDGWLRDVPERKESMVGFTFGQQDRETKTYIKGIVDGWYGRPIVSEWKRARGVSHVLYHSQAFVEYFKKLGVKAVRSDKKEVPETLWQAPREAVIGFLQGLFTADGTVRDNPKKNSSWVALTAKNKKLLQGVQLLLLNLGIKSTIFDRSRGERNEMFPYVTKAGKTVSYTTDGVLYELGIFGEGREKFRQEIGFLSAAKQKKLSAVQFSRFYSQHFEAEAVALIPLGKKPVYDLTEPLTHSMICNGLVVHQCGEQTLHPYDNCNLGSLNLSVFVNEDKSVDWERLEFATKTAVRLMDNVVDKFDFPVEQVTELALKNRRIGLGIMGFADMLYQMGTGYNTQEGLQTAEQVMGFVNRKAYEASQELAEEKGVFPNYQKSVFFKEGAPHSEAQQWGAGKKMRNAALTTVAPTGSISMMFDTSSGIEPNFALAYIKQDKDGNQYRYFNRYFQEALDKLHLSEEDQKRVMEEVVEKGSVQHLAELPEDLRRVFVVAMDISGREHMEMQAAFQRHVDNSISKTINFKNEATREEIAESFIAGWKLGCKSLTAYRDGSRTIQILNVGNGENVVAPTQAPGGRASSQSEQVSKRSVRPRPEVLSGKTYRMKTGYGNLYITVNSDERGKPFEVFATIGKSGGFFQEQSEAITRLISLALRSGVNIQEVIKHLSGIRGPMPVFTDKGTVLSLPDAIGKTLAEHIGSAKAIEDALARPQNQEVLPLGRQEENRPIADFGFMPGCPDCGAQLRMAEGCMSCTECGFSRCA